MHVCGFNLVDLPTHGIFNMKHLRFSCWHLFLSLITSVASNVVGFSVWDTLDIENILRRSSGTPSPLNTNITWPIKRILGLEGDVILGALMMIHERSEKWTCGPIMPQGGIQALEIMLFTLDSVNNDPDFLPGFKIGAHILDDCDRDTYGLEQAVDFIKGSISNIDDETLKCPDGTSPAVKHKVIAGVLGAASSVTSIQVANLLRLFKIPQVSFFSTSPELSNKERFEYFSRTVPSDTNQAKAMVEIVKLMNWTYLSVVYEESNYGIQAFNVLEERFSQEGICIALKEKLTKDSGVGNSDVYDNIVTKLKSKPNARGVIIFGSDQEVAELMKAVRRTNATGMFSWIGSDGWSARTLVSDGNEAEVEGTLSVQPRAYPVQGFDEYFRNRTVFNNKRNPWFVEYWEHEFKCGFLNSTITPYNQDYDKVCTGYETYEKLELEGQLQFVSDAVLTFAHAFKDMHRDYCGGKPGLCPRMDPILGPDLLKYLRNVNFTGLTGDEFQFYENGDGPSRYNIIHFKKTGSPNKYEWVWVGEYKNERLFLNMSLIRFNDKEPNIPESVCSKPCGKGQSKNIQEGDKCCWFCVNCTKYQILRVETQCEDCPLGYLPSSDITDCIAIPEVYLRMDSPWALSAMIYSSIGIIITSFILIIFIKNTDTPVVKASGRELSYVLLIGIFMCYGITFLLVMKPSDSVCGAQKFGIGFCFSVCYAALLTKTNRISRIFNAGKRSAKRPSFISPKSQLVICSCLVSIQVAISAVWLVFSPPRAIHHYPTREDNQLVCSSSIDASYMIAFTYPIILIIVCTIYAVLTRTIPEAFNESKYIGFTMYTTCIIWLAFVPIYFSTANNVDLRITTVCLSISLSGTVSLACLFTPKLYIILFHPERNVRQSMMPNKYNATKSTSLTSSSHRVDSGTQSDEMEMTTRLRPAGSFSSSISRSTSATQTVSNGTSCSTQTLDSIGKEFEGDVQL